MQGNDGKNIEPVLIKRGFFLWKINTRFFKHVDWIIILFLVVFSFLLTFKAGERGFFAFDQSFIFDGGYRVFLGQVPYKDFVIPFGPVVFWVQALFFKLVGVNYFAYILGAAVLNVLATICCIAIMRILFPGAFLASYMAGMLTAIWFYPPLGTVYTEQTALIFSLSALVIVLFVLINDVKKVSRFLLMIIAGCCAFLSCITKQNVGIFMFPLYIILIVTAHPVRIKKKLFDCGIFFVGFFLSVFVFIIWLIGNSDIRIFYRFFIQIPFSLGQNRVEGCLDRVLGYYFIKTNLIFLACISITSSFIALCYLFIIHKYKEIRNVLKPQLLAALICGYFVFFQFLFMSFTLNQAEEGYFFLGVIFAIALVLSWQVPGLSLPSNTIINNKYFLASPLVLRAVLVMSAFAAFVYSSVLGLHISFDRSARVFSNATFSRYVGIEKLKRLKWGAPTLINNEQITENDLVDLYQYLKKENKNFFIFPDFTIFYALLDAFPPQPLVWFHEGVTYPQKYDSGLDSWVVQSLRKNKVELVILEKESLFGTQKRLKNFMQLHNFINENFIIVSQIGIFDIYEKVRRD